MTINNLSVEEKMLEILNKYPTGVTTEVFYKNIGRGKTREIGEIIADLWLNGVIDVLEDKRVKLAAR